MSCIWNENQFEKSQTGHGNGVKVEKSEFRVRGRSFLVPMCRIEGREVISIGRWLRIATLKDEEWLEGKPIGDPIQFTNALRASGLAADIFTFSGPIDAGPVDRHGQFEIDNVAVIRTDDYKAWWEGLPQEARKNTRRAAKRGLEVRSAAFDDHFAAGIKGIYDEEPIRQGRKFWHYGKDLDAVRRENSTYLDRCQFLGAHYSGQLVGFIKFVYVGDAARIMQILCLNAHQDKRPMTALIARAVEICHKNGLKYLIYGKFTYGQKSDSSITEFKRRLGFEQKNFPRYYIPLSLRGRIALRLGAHRGWLELLPSRLTNYLLWFRKWYLERIPFQWNWNSLQLALSGRIFCGEPVPTSPENALKQKTQGVSSGRYRSAPLPFEPAEQPKLKVFSSKCGRRQHR